MMGKCPYVNCIEWLSVTAGGQTIKTHELSW